jgi:electron transfer flavoprotein alpha subunit
VASVLVHIETDGQTPLDASLGVLGEARRIATTLGAALHAYVQVVSDEHIEPLARTLGLAGADKVQIARGEAVSGPPIWATHGATMLRLCDDLRPVLVLFAADEAGADIAPRLAAGLGAAFVAEPIIESGPRGEVVFSRAVFGATHQRRLAAEDLEQTVVATLMPRLCRRARGEDEAEVHVIDAAEVSAAITYRERRPDPNATLADARVVVLAGAGVRSFETFGLIETLATLLGAEVAATGSLCQKGLASPDQEIGVGVRRIAPEMIVVCGAAGSSASLGAIAGGAEIIAINRDPDAPIFRVAQYGLVGDLDAVLPELIAGLRRRGRVAVTS